MTKENGIPGHVSVPKTRLAGREAELSILDETLRVVEEMREARIVTITGPQGIGKTRLVNEFVSRPRANGNPPRVVRGAARVGDASYGLFTRLLRARFGVTDSMDKETAKTTVRDSVSKVLDDRKVGDVCFFIGQLLDLPFEESPLTRAVKDEPVEGPLVRRAIVKAFLEADAQSFPMCLVFEDLHAADNDSLDLLRYLMEYLAGPVVFFCLGRPDFVATQENFTRAGEGRHRLIELGALSESEASSLLEELLAPAHSEGKAPPQLIELALGFANGNPALIEQMVRIYHDEGVLKETTFDGVPKWAVNLDKLDSAELPMTIEDAVSARLAALEAEERKVLEFAAVMGSVFWSAGFLPLLRMGKEAPELWRLHPDSHAENARISSLGIVGTPAELLRIEEILRDLVERDYLLKLPDSTFPNSDEYIFKHNKERETIQKRTPAGAQKRYHAVLADWMDHQEAIRSNEEHIAMLAEHREKAGDLKRAGLDYVDAGSAARSRYANTKASEYFEKGLELLGDDFASRRIDALHDYGDVLLLSGRIDDAQAAFREMLTLAFQLNLLHKGGAAHNRIGRLFRDTGALDEAQKHLEAAMALFRAAGDERGVASTTDDIGKLAWMRGDYTSALTYLQDGLARRRRVGDRRSIALSFNNLGNVYQETGEFGQALEAFQQALSIRREIGDLVGVVATFNSLGVVAQHNRDFDRALALFQDAYDAAKQIGDRNRIALVLTNIGECQYRSGNPGKAIELLKEAEEQFDELGDKLGLAEVLRALGKAHLLQGDLTKARDAIGRAVDLFAQVRSKVHLGTALRTLGEITAAGGWGAAHTKSAREYFQRSCAIFEQTGNDIELGRSFKAFAKFLGGADFANEPAALADAKRMDVAADGIFARLKVGIDATPKRQVARPSDPDEIR